MDTFLLRFLAQASSDLNWLRLPTNEETIPSHLVGNVGLAIMGIALLVGAAFYVRNRIRAITINRQLNDARFRMLVRDLSLTRTELQLLQLLQGNASPAGLLELMEARDKF